MWKIAAIGWFIIEVVLSHTPGDKSGEESRTLSRLTHVDERLLRRAAHVFLFLALSFCAGMGWQWIGIGAVGVWAVIDELTKRRVSGRHCSAFDMILNLAGTVIGMAVWLLVR